MNLFEKDNIRWQFNELIKTLIAISLPADKQRQIYGIGLVGDEMVEDFYTYFTLIKDSLIERGFINQSAQTILDQIDNYTDVLSNEKNEDFWDEIEIHEEWEKLRTMAKEALINLEKENLGLKVNHDNKMDKKDNIIVQRTTIELTDKKGNVIEL